MWGFKIKATFIKLVGIVLSIKVLNPIHFQGQNQKVSQEKSNISCVQDLSYMYISNLIVNFQ